MKRLTKLLVACLLMVMSTDAIFAAEPPNVVHIKDLMHHKN